MRCLIVDDEPIARDVLLDYAQKLAGLEVVAACASAVAALEILENESVDLLFLDIEMPELTGLELIDALGQPPLVVLTTAYPEYAVRGYDYDVVDYLLKPIAFSRFVRAVARARRRRPDVDGDAGPLSQENSNESDSSASAGAGGGLRIEQNGLAREVPFAVIVVVKSLGNYVTIETDGGSYTVYGTLKAMEQVLPSDRFARCHKSYIVGLDRARGLSGGTLELESGESIPVGRTYSRAVSDALRSRRLQLP